MCNTSYAPQLSVRGHWKLVCEECRPRTHITSPGRVWSHTHNCSPVPPVLSHDRFCGTSQWRQGLERQKHGVVACRQHKCLRSSSVDQVVVQVLVAVSCCVAKCAKWCCVAYPATNTRSRRVQQQRSVGQEDLL